MTLFVIRHKATGKLMPQLTGRARGYSHWNPSRATTLKKAETGIPRFLSSATQARQCIAQWNANPNGIYKGYTSFAGEDDYFTDTTDDGRTKDDLEVVMVEVIGL